MEKNVIILGAVIIQCCKCESELQELLYCQHLNSDVDNHIDREGGVGRCGRGNQGGGGFLQLLHRIKLTHVLLVGSHS